MIPEDISFDSLTADDFTFVDCSLVSFTDISNNSNDNNCDLEITTPSDSCNVHVYVDANKFENKFGIQNDVSFSSAIWTYDKTKPSVSISSANKKSEDVIDEVWYSN